MYVWNDGTELYHHGILGQRWGKRNGPPYPLGAEDHSAAEKKAGWRKSLSSNSSSKKERRKARKAEKYERDVRSVINFNKPGNKKSAEEQRKDAENYLKLEKASTAILTAGLLAGGAVAVYATLEKHKYDGDFTIKKGSEVYRVQSKDYPELPSNFFYATPDKADANIYKGGWGEKKFAGLFGLIGTGEYKNAINIGVKDDVKIAGMESARKIFNLIKNDETFVALSGLSNADYKDVEHFLDDAPLDKKNPAPFLMFQYKMLDAGYGGVIDHNDKFGEGWEMRAPVILFNQKAPGRESGSFAIKKVESLNKQIIKKYEKYYDEHMHDLKAKKMGLLTPREEGRKELLQAIGLFAVLPLLGNIVGAEMQKALGRKHRSSNKRKKK